MADEPGGDDPVEETGATEAADGSPSAVPPRVVLAESLAPARDLLSRGGAVVGLPEPAVLAADVRSMAPHERFTESAGRHADRLGIESVDAASLAAVGEELPVADPVERATTFLARRGGRLQGELLAQLDRDPARPRDYLLLAVAASHLQHAAIDLQVAVVDADDQGSDAVDAGADAGVDEAAVTAAAGGTGERAGRVELLAGIAIALSARFVGVVGEALDAPTARDPEAAARDDPLEDELVLDVALADHHRERARGETPSFDPVERDVDDLRELLAVQGASLAVGELDADPVAIATLAGVPAEHVLAVLDGD